MRYTVQLTHGQTCGQIPVKNDQGEIVYILKGNLNEFNQPIILTDINHNEIGRLYLDSNHLLASYSVDVVNHSLVKVKKFNSRFTNLFYITRYYSVKLLDQRKFKTRKIRILLRY